MTALHPWDAVLGVGSHRDGPRKANDVERSAYIAWLADKRGCSIDDVVMPELAEPDAIIFEELDDAGEATRTSRIGLKNGKLPWDAKKVRGLVGKIAKTRMGPAAETKSPAPAKAKRAPAPAITPSEELHDMDKAVIARMDALETMVRDLCTALAAQAGAGSAIVTPVAHEAAPAEIALCEAVSEEIDAVSFLDLIGEPVSVADELPAPVADPALADQLAASQARVARLEVALARMVEGRRRQARGAHRAKRQAVEALATAQQAGAALVGAEERAVKAEATLRQVQPVLDMLDQMRPREYQAPEDDGFCKPARGTARWPKKAAA